MITYTFYIIPQILPKVNRIFKTTGTYNFNRHVFVSLDGTFFSTDSYTKIKLPPNKIFLRRQPGRMEIFMKVFVLTRKNIALLGILAVSAVLFAGINTVVSVSVNPKKIPIYSVERPDNKIALTFNCAWGAEDIPQILDTLKKHDTKATFFTVGTWAEKYPDAVKSIVAAGHEVGSHSYNHGHYQKMSYDEILTDIKKCDEILAPLTAKNSPLVRGGYGEYSNDVLAACENSGHTYIQWSVDSLDYKAKSCEDILGRVLGKTQNGDIILMHTGTEYTAAALDALLDSLCAKHTPVTISELIYSDNFTIDHSGRQIPNS